MCSICCPFELHPRLYFEEMEKSIEMWARVIDLLIYRETILSYIVHTRKKTPRVKQLRYSEVFSLKRNQVLNKLKFSMEDILPIPHLVMLIEM